VRGPRERVTTLAALGTVDTPADLEAHVHAQLAFYQGVAATEPEPRASAFRSLAGYYDALRAFYEPRGWRQATLEEVTQLPQPPRDGSAEQTAQALAERCGVELPTDQPVP
jgi:hypothetical protein